MFRKTRRIHFVGIGGIGMSGIAEVLRNLNYEVSGSDLHENTQTRRLADLGATIHIGHREENIAGADVLVTSSIIPADNPEVQAARAAFIPVIPRAEMLAELMRMKFGIAVAGTHGKTTTTSLIATILGAAELDPTVVVGGRLDSIGSNAKLGGGPYLVAEADESDGSFLLLSPMIGVVTNIDPEHMDYYSGLEHLRRTFELFINKVPFYGLMVLCIDHENVQALLPKMHKRYVTYGLSPQADLVAQDVTFDRFQSRFTVVDAGAGSLGEVTIGIPGMHNVYNTLAAICVARELEIPFDVVRAALKDFRGVGRRFERVAEVGDVLIIDDYGHHPMEIRATLAAAKSFDRRIVACFQPHRYTRTRDRFEEFLTAFNDADILVITDIYAANEKPIEGVTARKMFDGVRACGHKHVLFEPDKSRLVDMLADIAEPGDLVITLGAGDVTRIAHGLSVELQDRAEATS
ncbi:UDP-N-acetylmuramate--L-alanine ligase [bacterium]|nr:UDP-N-acetylmuramate--L-alanine ligase [bacterium]